MKLLPELAACLLGVVASPPLSPPEEKSRLFESLYQVLRRVAANAPLILALEDVHWADSASLELLYFLGRRLRRDRWLAVATYRPEELVRAEGLARLREDLLRDRLGQELMLKSLSTEEIGELLHEVIGGDPAQLRSLAGLICHYGEGNPFFSEEILRAIVDAGDSLLITFDPTTVSAVPIPPTVQETIRLRLRQLTSEARMVLAAAAVLGRTFDLETLQQVTDLVGDAFSRPFMELLSHQLIRAERTPRCYGFRHHLIREVVMQNLAPDLRRALHGRVGLLLEGTTGAAQGVPQLLMHHFGEAGDRERTVRYGREAAWQASAVYAHEDAGRYLSLALDALPTPATSERLSVAEGLGDAWYQARRFEQSLQALAVMRECAMVLDAPRDLARAHRKIGTVGNVMRVGAGLPALETGLAIVAKIDAPSEEALIRAEMAFVACQAGQFAQAVTEARAGVAAAARAGDPKALSRCYWILGVSLQSLGQYAEARESLKKAVAQAREANDLEAETSALNSLGCRAKEDADFVAAREALERACESVDKVGGMGCIFHAVLSLSELCLLEGRWDEAESLSRRVVLQLEELSRPFTFGFAALDLATVYLLRGRFDDAEALLRDAENSESSENTNTLLNVFNAQAQMALVRRTPAIAQKWLEKARALCESSRYAGAPRAESLLLITEAHVQNGDAAAAKESLEQAMQAAQPFRYLAPWVSRVTGLVAAHVGLLDEAIRHYQVGLDTLVAASQPYQEGLIRRELGVCHLRRNHQGDRRVARTQLAHALELFQRLGAQPDAEIVQQGLHRIGGRIPAGLALTIREQEVLALIAEGLSNAAIAGRLYLSERTVEVHVSHILSKLGVESRSHAVAWIAKHTADPNKR
jgi:DNA-binding CsgD family transcriptional regulator